MIRKRAGWLTALFLGEMLTATAMGVFEAEISKAVVLALFVPLIIGFLRITIWSAFSTVYGAHWLLVAITVSVSLVGVVLWGTLSGSLLPFLLKRLGFDPAASSA